MRYCFHDRILYYHNRINIGSGYNWNRGVELAQGEWVCFLHDDDVMCSNALMNIGRIIRQYHNLSKPLGYIHANRVEFTDHFDQSEAIKRSSRFCKELTRTGALICGHSQTGCPSCGTTILKKAYMEVGGINYDFGPTADAVLGYQIMKNYTVLQSDAILGGYRWAENESLKVSTLQALVKADNLFAQYRYTRNTVSHLWGRFFGDVQSIGNIRSKIAIAQIGHLSLSPTDFDVQKPSACFTIRKVLCRLIRLVYQCAVYEKAFWFASYLRLEKKRRGFEGR